MTSQEFLVTDVLRLQVQEGFPDLPNEILNPSGEGGAWGWRTESAVPGAVSLSSNGERLRFQVLADLDQPADAAWSVPIAPSVAGDQVRASVNVTFLAGAGGSWKLNAFTSGGVEENLFPDPVAVGLNELPATDLPVGTVLLVLAYVVPDGTLAGRDVRFNEAWLIHGSAADVAASDPLSDPPWVDVLGSANALEIERDELNVSTLTATIRDSTLDPASTDLIRPGKRCRLDALVSGVWESLFTGKLENPSTAYELTDPKVSDLRRVRIQLVASDAAADLANEPRPEGVALISELPYVLLGTGVPFNVNGSDDAIAPASVAVVAVNDQASALDQVAITRDGALGYAWVDRAGVLQVWDRDELGTEVALEVNEEQYSDANVDFDVERTFNTIDVELLRINPGTGETETVPFGPYVDEAARREWGARKATFKVQGLDDTDIPDYAAAILELNARPVKRINAVTFPIRTVDELEAYALLDLYDLLELANDVTGITGQLSRITSMKHRITIKKQGARLVNRWWLDLAFSTDGSVATPTVSPTPTPGVTGAKTMSELLRPIGEVTMWYGAPADLPPGWLICNGAAFDDEQYPRLAELLEATGLPAGVLPSFEDRFPIGAGTKALGTSGTSALTGATAGDWRAVWFIIRAA